MATPKHMITDDSATLVWKGQTYTVKKGDPNFDAARKAIFEERWEDVPLLVSKGLGISQWASQVPGFAFVDNFITYNGEKLPSALNERMVKMAKGKDDPTFLMRFWERLQENPSWRSVNQLYNFLKHQGIAIDKDGHLLTYKAVRQDYKDIHSGTVDNSIGVTNQMPRNKISDDPTKGCHFGFHVGALSYAQSFGGSSRRLLICKVDPKDVVCIPNDSSFKKMRVCKYKVLGHYGDQLPDTTFDTEADMADVDDDLEELDDDLEELDDDLEELDASDLEPIDPESEVTETKPWGGEKVEEQQVSKVLSEATEATPDWANFDSLSDEELKAQKLGPLRKYARHNLKIIGASKIRGGKPALLTRIFDVRRPTGDEVKGEG